MRFMRNYELIITLTSGEVVKITPEIRIQFEAVKSIRGGLNNCKIKIYNLSEEKRLKLVKDKEDGSKLLPFLLRAGYSKMDTLFKGNVWEAYSVKMGADFITFISSLDGGYAFINSFTSKTINGGDYREFLLKDMQGISKGAFTNSKKLLRPKVLVGNPFKLIEESLGDDETYYIDGEKLYILKDDEVVDGFIPLVSPETGLLETPVKKNQEVSFKTLLNPALRIGGLVELRSVGAKNLNGVYKIITIKYRGDYYGGDWLQEVVCMGLSDYKVVK